MAGPPGRIVWMLGNHYRVPPGPDNTRAPARHTSLSVPALTPPARCFLPRANVNILPILAKLVPKAIDNRLDLVYNDNRNRDEAGEGKMAKQVMVWLVEKWKGGRWVEVQSSPRKRDAQITCKLLNKETDDFYRVSGKLIKN